MSAKHKAMPSTNSPKKEELDHKTGDLLMDTDWEHFFRRHKKLIIGAMLVALACLLGYQLGGYFGKKRMLEIQEAYCAAETTSQKETFIDEHSSESLAGIFALELADKAFEKEDWKRAENFYQAAIKALRARPLEGKAWIGLAEVRFKIGQHESVVQTLETLLGKESVEASFRAQAAYMLALLAVEKDDYLKARLYLGQLDNLNDSGLYWRQKGMILRFARADELGLAQEEA